MSKQFRELLNSSELALKDYNERDTLGTFESLEAWQKARLAEAHPDLLLAMIRDERSLDAITKCISDAPGDLEYYNIPDSWGGYGRRESRDNNWNLRSHSVAYRKSSSETAAMLYSNSRIFDSLAITEKLGILLQYPNLLRQFITDNKLVGLEPKRLSFLVTCLCIVSRCPDYGGNLSDLERNTLCFRIAEEPSLLVKLLPAARIIFLARLKQISPALKSGLPKVILDTAEQAHDLPLVDRHAERGIKTLRAFWLPTIVGMGTGDYDLQFSAVLDCAFIRNNYHNIPKVEAEALALAVVLDPRFVTGLPNSMNPRHPRAQLSSSDGTQLIAQHNLSGKIKGYEEFTKTLASMPARCKVVADFAGAAHAGPPPAYLAAGAACAGTAANSAAGAAGAGANAVPALVYSAAGARAASAVAFVHAEEPPPAYSTTKINAFPNHVLVLVYSGARADAAFPPPAYSDANSGAGAGGNVGSANTASVGAGANAAQVNAVSAGAGAASPANAGASAVPGGPSVMVEDDEQPGSQPASSSRRGT